MPVQPIRSKMLRSIINRGTAVFLHKELHVTRPTHCPTFTSTPFGTEYKYRPAWGLLERLYIGTFGLVDLPGRIRARIVLRELAKVRHEHILDFGCGTGCYSFYLSRNPANEVCGLDVNASRINDCRAIANHLGRNNLRFTLGSTKNGLSGFHDATFDAVLAVEVLTCVPDVKATFAEFHRILRADGCVVGHVPILAHLRQSETTMFNDEKLAQLLEESGFEKISISRTFGRDTLRLCKILDRVTRSRMLSAIFFPFLLIASSICSVKSPDGGYRLFVAHKVLGGAPT